MEEKPKEGGASEAASKKKAASHLGSQARACSSCLRARSMHCLHIAGMLIWPSTAQHASDPPHPLLG
eukprot:9904502-Alexandrium_andersonii.AAC.1